MNQKRYKIIEERKSKDKIYYKRQVGKREIILENK